MQKIEKGLFSVVPVITVSGLHPFAQCIYMWLCKYASETGQCRPSIHTLCKNTRIGKNSVLKYLNILEQKGFIKKTNRYKEGEYTSNMYDVFVMGGSATRELPSAGDELGGGAGVAPPSAGGGKELNPLTKSTILTKSNNTSSNDEEPKAIDQLISGKENELLPTTPQPPSFGDPDINRIIQLMKDVCNEVGLQYMPGFREREFAKHILSKKLAQEIKKYNMPLEEFIKNIIRLSTQPYMKQVNTPELFYQNWGHVINASKQKKQTQQQTEKKIVYLS